MLGVKGRVGPLFMFAMYMLVVVYAGVAHGWFGALDSVTAVGGFSALDFSNAVLFPENFTRDYPAGAIFTGKSALSWVYPAVQSLGGDVELLLQIMIVLEIFVLSLGACFLLKTFFPGVQAGAYIVLTLLLALSWARLPNLANFGNPYFHGQFYGFADGLALAGIACFFRGRHWLSAAILLLAFTIHPIKTLFAALVIAAIYMQEYDWRLTRDRFLPYLLFSVAALFWVWFWLGGGESDGRMSTSEFFEYSPLLNWHWYPELIGVFTGRHSTHATPFVSAVVITLSVLCRGDVAKNTARKICIALMVLVIVAAVGVLNGYLQLSVPVTKVCLQRCTVLVLSLAVILLLGQLVEDVKRGRWLYVALGAICLFAGFWLKTTWPVLASVVYAVITLISTRKNAADNFIRVLLVLFLLVLVFFQVFLWWQGYLKLGSWLGQFHLLAYAFSLAAALYVLSFISYLAAGEWAAKRLPVVIISALVVASLYGGENWATTYRQKSDSFVSRAQAYKSVQNWANANTAEKALFIVDPCQNYGWRDYSVRSSFGVVGEWYKNGWLYHGDAWAFTEGFSRGRMLGIQQDELAEAKNTRHPGKAFLLLCKIARENYYREDQAPLLNIVKTYGVDYVVMDKGAANKSGSLLTWPVVYENKFYSVYSSIVE